MALKKELPSVWKKKIHRRQPEEDAQWDRGQGEVAELSGMVNARAVQEGWGEVVLKDEMRDRERGRERERERERMNDLLFHLLMHSLAASCMCPDWRSNLQPWRIGMTL